MKKLSEFDSWEGCDVDTATSIFVYGLMFNPNAKENECNIVYGIAVDNEGTYNRFTFSSVNWSELLAETWIDWSAVCSFAGCERSDFDNFSVLALSDLVSYYGIENVFGGCYDSGFQIVED